MKYQKLGNTDIEVSRISFGAWGIGGGNVWSDMSVDVRHVRDLLDHSYDLGINYIDTAPVYGVGTSEKILGEALKGCRDRFIVQTKCCLNWRNEGGEFEYVRDGYTVNKDHHASAIRKDVEDSLVRMSLDHIDVEVVHRMSSVVPVEETMSELNKLIEEGKIRAVIISNSEPQNYEEYAKYGVIAGVQEKFSLLSDDKRRYFDTLKKYGAVFQVYGSLDEGILAGPAILEKTFGADDIRSKSKWMKEPGRTALKKMYEMLAPLCEKYNCSYANLVQAWTLRQDPNINLLTGFRRFATMDDTCKVFDISLSDEDVQEISRIAEITKKG